MESYCLAEYCDYVLYDNLIERFDCNFQRMLCKNDTIFKLFSTEKMRKDNRGSIIDKYSSSWEFYSQIFLAMSTDHIHPFNLNLMYQQRKKSSKGEEQIAKAELWKCLAESLKSRYARESVFY